MFGSDQMVWPETLEVAIQSIEQAAFLTPGQKRDIFYNNAARFLKLSEAKMSPHAVSGRRPPGLPCTLPAFMTAVDSTRRDVHVHVEHVLRIVLGLDLAQPREIRTVHGRERRVSRIVVVHVVHVALRPELRLQ